MKKNMKYTMRLRWVNPPETITTEIIKFDIPQETAHDFQDGKFIIEITGKPFGKTNTIYTDTIPAQWGVVNE
jgi:hypothetical protein